MKNRILIPTYYFDPAYKAGGPVKSISEIVKVLADKIDVTVITTNRDIDGARLKINHLEIESKYNSKIIYLNRFPSFIFLFTHLIKNKYDYVYVNSFFSIKENLYLSFLSLFFKYKIIISIRGQIMEGAMKKKKRLKELYISCFKFFFYKKIDKFHITNEIELSNLIYYFGDKVMQKVFDLPNLREVQIIDSNFASKKEKASLKIFFFSRIVPKKNLLYVLEILKMCNLSNITLDIYGTKEDLFYWDLCQQKISEIDIKINYLGVLDGSNVMNTIKNYDLFFFPTFGENFGHVILEALEAGVPVLLSDTTPFNNDNLKGAGWAFSLSEMDSFVNKILDLYDLNNEEYQIINNDILRFVLNFKESNSIVKQKYLDCFS